MTPLPLSDAVCARYHVVHETRVAYRSLVTLSQQYLHMTPRSFPYQQIDSHELWVNPTEDDGADGIDYFGNKTRQMTITAPHRTLLVHAESTVALTHRHDLARIQGTSSWEGLRDRLNQGMDTNMVDAYRYLYASPHVICSPELERFARISYTPGRPQLDAALALTQRIFDEFEFDDTATEISTPLEEVLKGRRGVCQDFAQLMIGCLRSLGLPARYVSGYILTHPPAGQPRLVGADASHAWASVFCPGLGWIDFDPTNRCLVQHDHITLGWGRDFSDVTPMRGVVLGGGKQDLEVRVTVTPVPLHKMSAPTGF
jgi:transglutaminase-like putative cysteine protease